MVANKILARRLRKNLTEAEKTLWQQLQFKQLHNYKFRRQCPIGRYVADFVCFEKKIIIELDGGQHSDQAIYDSERTKWFESQGFQVLRFWNDQVLTEIQSVLESIMNVLTPHLSATQIGGSASGGNPPPSATQRSSAAEQLMLLWQAKRGEIRPQSVSGRIAPTLCGEQGGRK